MQNFINTISSIYERFFKHFTYIGCDDCKVEFLLVFKVRIAGTLDLAGVDHLRVQKYIILAMNAL